MPQLKIPHAAAKTQRHQIKKKKKKEELCDNLQGRDGVGGGREAQKGGDICIPMADPC